MERMLKRLSTSNNGHLKKTPKKVKPAVKPAVKAKRGKNPAAVLLGKLGGRKGGLMRAANLTAAQRSDIARKAALARWNKKPSEASVAAQRKTIRRAGGKKR